MCAIQKDLFGERTIVNNVKKKDTYSDFVDKFTLKKTTDDCYTPDAVYDIIIDYVSKRVDLSDKKIIRPFYPGMDYKKEDYPENGIVIDNPPFSILSGIIKYYTDRKIKYFLFAPHMTLFSNNADCTMIVCGADITYQNGAIVKTSFITNMFNDIKIIGDSKLYNELMYLNDKIKKNLPKYIYPDNTLTVSMCFKYIENGLDFEIMKKDVQHCRALDSQKLFNKSFFGGGFLVSDKVVELKNILDYSVNQNTNTVIWNLSDREKQIIKKMSDDKDYNPR